MSRSPIPPRAGRALVAWFRDHRRDLPWRQRYDPFQVLVAEFMGQQTQMDRVVPYFLRFVERFPDAASLAAAGEEEVLRLWEGLGYYARARRLHEAARVIVAQGGRVPENLKDLRALPGVGAYTAAAVASQAFNLDVPALDANAERVLARLLDLATPVKHSRGRKALQAAVRGMSGGSAPRELNQALMELGALVCRPRSPRCRECPVRGFCRSRKAGTTAQRPVPEKRPGVVHIVMVTGVLLREGRALVQKRRAEDVWPGLWEFPGGVVEIGESEEAALAREYREEVSLEVRAVEKITTIRYSYTRYHVHLHAWRVEESDPTREPSLNAATHQRFAAPAELAELAFPSGHRRLVETLDRERPGWWPSL